MRAWLNRVAAKDNASREEFIGRVRSILDWLDARDGKPDGRRLFNQGGGLCAAYFSLGGFDWAFGYYVEPEGDILLLTTFHFNKGTVDQQVDFARQEMVRCVALGHRVEDL